MSSDLFRGVHDIFLPKKGRKMYTPLRTSDETNENHDKDFIPANMKGWYTSSVLLFIASTIATGMFGFGLGYQSWHLSVGTKEGNCPIHYCLTLVNY